MGHIPHWLFALASCLIFCGSLWAQDTLTEADQREILNRLYELQSARQTIMLQQAHIAKLEDLSTRESELQQKEAELCQKQQEVGTQRETLLMEQVAFYKNAYQTLSKKRSWKCTLAKVFTLGIARCTP